MSDNPTPSTLPPNEVIYAMADDAAIIERAATIVGLTVVRD